ncbi:MAG: DnaJ domain-containing protein [Nitrospirae bacterium]|nr:DnaJ domain-containing protein [Nitrospirota bacterium]
MKDYYEALGISQNASQSEIKSAYRNLVKQYHPDNPSSKDLVNAEEKFLLINEAYETLIDESRRKVYDESIALKAAGKTVSGESIKDRARNYFYHGRKAYKAGNFNKAINLFQTAINLDSQSPLYYSWLGLALSNMPDKLSEAKKWCEKAIKLSPHNSDYYVNLALIYREAGIKSMAVRYLKEALKWDPENQRALSWLYELEDKKTNFKDRLKGFFQSGLKK